MCCSLSRRSERTPTRRRPKSRNSAWVNPKGVMEMRGKPKCKLVLPILCVMLFALVSKEAHAKPSASAALVGQVSSQAEGPMEGVLVSAKKEGSTITITVVSDAQGQYSFPR